MNFSFKRSFAPQVISGAKGCTIRDCSKRMPRQGMKFTAVTGPRYKPQVLTRSAIELVVPIELDLRGQQLEIKLQRRGLTQVEVEEIARLDGFENARAMQLFFRNAHGAVLLSDDVWRWIVWGESLPLYVDKLITQRPCSAIS